MTEDEQILNLIDKLEKCKKTLDEICRASQHFYTSSLSSRPIAEGFSFIYRHTDKCLKEVFSGKL